MSRLNDTTAAPAADTAPATGKALTPVRSALNALDSSGALSRALPTGLSSTRFARIISTELSKTPALEQCTPPSVLGAVMTAAQLGLEFGPLGHAYLVPFRDNKTGTMKCTLIIGYRGMIDLSRRTGRLRSIVARPVRENDFYDESFGTDEFIRHKPSRTNRGAVLGYYGVAQLADGGVHHEPLMSVTDVDRFRRRSATQREKPSGPWVTDFDAMACKTVIRRMWPWLPSTVEAAQAIESDEKVINWTGSENVIDIDSDVDDVDPVDDIPEAVIVTTTDGSGGEGVPQ